MSSERLSVQWLHLHHCTLQASWSAGVTSTISCGWSLYQNLLWAKPSSSRKCSLSSVQRSQEFHSVIQAVSHSELASISMHVCHTINRTWVLTPAWHVYHHHPLPLPLTDAYAGYFIRKKHPEKHKQGPAYAAPSPP